MGTSSITVFVRGRVLCPLRVRPFPHLRGKTKERRFWDFHEGSGEASASEQFLATAIVSLAVLAIYLTGDLRIPGLSIGIIALMAATEMLLIPNFLNPVGHVFRSIGALWRYSKGLFFSIAFNLSASALAAVRVGYRQLTTPTLLSFSNFSTTQPATLTPPIARRSIGWNSTIEKN